MRDIFKAEIETVREVMLRLPWEDAHFYASYLTQTYYFVRHSTRLLAMASAYAKFDQDALHRRFGSHIAEEKGHDLIALADLKKLGFLELEEELPATRNLYEGQYYKIQKLDSAALLGYILALEGVASSVCPLFIERIYQAYGKQCALFLKLHVEEDPDHVDKAFEQVEALPATLRQLVEENLVQSFRNYVSFLKNIESHALAEKRELRKNSRATLQVDI